MKKVWFIIMIGALTLWASAPFWQSLEQIENDFFDKATILQIIEDTNETDALDENQTTTGIDEKFKRYDALIHAFKNKPYMLDDNISDDFDPLRNQEAIKRVILRVESNKKYGYKQAVNRDKIKLETLNLKKDIYQFFHYLANNWTKLHTKSLQKYIKKKKQHLASYPLTKNIQIYKKATSQKGIISNEIEKNFFEFAKEYYFFESFLDYLSVNTSILTYRSFANELQLDNLINYINKQPFAAKANVYLRYIKTDMGRLTLFVEIILFFLFLNVVVYKKLYNYFKARILAVKDEIDELLIENLDRIKRPFFLLINGIGIELAIEVLKYPQALGDTTNLLFYIFFVALIAYIMMQLVENIFFIYFHDKQSRDDVPLRAELLNLMLSVAKVLIFLIATIVVLIKMGVNITGLLASLGIGGLAVALAAQSTLSNFFGLLKIIFDESFSQGDWIETKDVEGTVVETGFISTKIRTFDNALITVPNAELANTPLKNWSRRTIGRRIKMHIGVTYSAKRKNLKAAIADIDRMLKEHDDIVTIEKVDHRSLKRRYKSAGKFLSTDDKLGVKTTQLVFLDAFSDSSVDILIYAFSKSTQWRKWLEVKEDILYKIWEILELHELEFAFPSQSLYFDKENIKALKELKE